MESTTTYGSNRIRWWQNTVAKVTQAKTVCPMEKGWYCQLCAGSGVTTQPCGNAATVVVVVVVEVAVEAQQYAYTGHYERSMT